jgi:outer membrane immunogenic protein
MKTVKISALVLGLAGVFAANANAQSAKTNPWEGAYGELKAGYASFSPNVGNGTTSYPNAAFPVIGATPATGSYTASANTLNTGTAAISAGYNFAVNSQYLLGIGASYYTGATGSGSATLNPSVKLPAALGGASVPGEPVNLNYQLKNLWAITVQPGYAIDKDRLVYAKVGYTGVTMGASGTSNPSTLSVAGGGSSVPYQTVNLSGYSIGFGYKQMITSSIYLLGEANYGSFSNKTATVNVNNAKLGGAANATGTFGGSGFDLLVGVGYRF